MKSARKWNPTNDLFHSFARNPPQNLSMNPLKRCSWALVASLYFIPFQTIAGNFEDEFDTKPWSEIEVQLPAFPEKENLVQFKVGAVSNAQFFIDEKSISVGSDAVIRYTLVIISSAGAQNISFEGMRCATTERRLYAFGHPGKTWSRARKSPWVKIQGDSNQHHVELFKNYFCSIGINTVSTAEDARKALRDGR